MNLKVNPISLINKCIFYLFCLYYSFLLICLYENRWMKGSLSLNLKVVMQYYKTLHKIVSSSAHGITFDWRAGKWHVWRHKNASLSISFLKVFLPTFLLALPLITHFYDVTHDTFQRFWFYWSLQAFTERLPSPGF